VGKSNFLIGRGELLSRDIKAPGGGRPKAEVYTLLRPSKLYNRNLKKQPSFLMRFQMLPALMISGSHD